MRARPLRPERALTHPMFLVALAVLVTNDHALKGAGLLPGWLTGKLSDVAGLFVAAPLLSALLRARSRQAILLVHLVVGYGFAALELSPALAASADLVYRMFGFSWRQVSDPTDLGALFVLPIAFRWTVEAGAREASRRFAQRAVVVASLFACTASTGGKALQQGPCGGPDCDGDGFSPPEDCNDTDPSLSPGHGCPSLTAEEVCDDGRDDDGDGRVDCDDSDCDLACAELEAVCAASMPLDFGSVQTLIGSTVTGTSVTDASCAGADAPEVIFSGSVPVAGVLSLAPPQGHAVSVRRECIERASEIACASKEGERVEALLSAGPVAIVVEALDPLAPSAFDVPVHFEPMICGDGKRVGSEECDDGGTKPGDGCDELCRVERDVLCATLPDAPLGASPGTFTGGTKGFVGACGGGFDQPERGYHYVPTTASVTFTASSSADVILYVMAGCGDAAMSLGCVDATQAGGTETLTVHPAAGQALTAFVELAQGAPPDATFTLDVSEP